MIASGNDSYKHTNIHSRRWQDLVSRFNTDIHQGLEINVAHFILESEGGNNLSKPKPPNQVLQWTTHVFVGYFNKLVWSAVIVHFILTITESLSAEREHLDVCITTTAHFIATAFGQHAICL